MRDASHFHDRGFLLSLCKVRGLCMIRVDASKRFAVAIKHFGFPVVVFPPSVLLIRCGLVTFHKVIVSR